MKAIIPVAGYATRLHPLTINHPKALLTIKNKPILSNIIEKIMELDISEIYIVTNDKFYNHFLDWKKSSNFGLNCNIKILNDGTNSNEARLGQIGDIYHVIDQENIDDDVLIVAGDNLFEFSLKDAYNSFLDKKTFLNALTNIESVEAAKQLGNVEINKDNRILSFEEKPQIVRFSHASVGIYFIPDTHLKYFSEFINNGHDPDKMGYFWIWALEQGLDIHGHIYEDHCFDIGHMQILEEARKYFQ